MANFVQQANAARKRGAKSFKYKAKDGKVRTYHARVHKSRNGGSIVVWHVKSRK